MTHKELLNALWWENGRKYSFEKAFSIIIIAKQDGRFEDENIIVTANRGQECDTFNLEWKSSAQ